MTNTNCLLRVAIASALTLGAAAHAQDLPETIVVTGRAASETARKVDVSYAITTIDSESLRKDAPLGVADALGNVPGFWVESSGGEASANIRARGIPQEGFSSVGMEEDGLPIQHDPGLGWLNADQAFRLDDTIERIEVVRGGPASMFSSNAPGGVVNFITRRPGDAPEGHVKIETSDYGLMRADAWYGLPIGDWRVGVGGFYREDDGIRDPGYTANKGGQARLSIGRSFENGTIDFNVKHINDNVIFYTGLPLTYDGDGDIVGVPGIDEHYGTLSGPDTKYVTLRNSEGTFPLDITRGTDVELTQYTLRANYDLPGDWRLSNGFRHRTSESSRVGLFPNTPVPAAARLNQLRNGIVAAVPGATDIQLRYVNSPETVFNVTNQNGNGLISDGSLREVSVPLDEWINDLRVTRKFDVGGQSHDVAIGVYFARLDETFTRYSANSLVDVRDNARLLNIVAVDAAGNPLATITENGITRYGSEFANGTGDSTTWAIYAADEWQIASQWRLDFGARWETVKTNGSAERSESRNLGLPGVADDAVLTGTGVRDTFDEKFDDLGWSAGVNWQFQPNSGVFARYTSTFRLPSVGSYITSANAQPVIQTMEFIEGGYKLDTPRWSAYLVGFLTNYDNFGFGDSQFDPLTGNYVTRTVYTDTETVGVEVESTVRATEWFDVSVQATWQDAEFGDFKPTQLVGGVPVTFDFTGNQLLRIPELSYRITPALNLLNGDLRFELDYQYFDKRYSDAANSVALPDYDVVNANLSWSVVDQITLYVHGENLLNEVGLTEGNPRAGSFVSGEAGSPFFIGRPIFGRNYRFSFVWNF